MPQGALAVAQTPNNGGTSSVLNIGGNVQVKVGAGRLASILFSTLGASGALTVYDVASAANATQANQILTLAWNATGLVAGEPLMLNFPFKNGLYITAPGGSPLYAVAYA